MKRLSLAGAGGAGGRPHDGRRARPRRRVPLHARAGRRRPRPGPRRIGGAGAAQPVPAARAFHRPSAALPRGDEVRRGCGRPGGGARDRPERHPPAAGRELRERVEKGAGLLVVLGENAAAGEWRSEARRPFFPAPFGAAADRSSDWGGTLAYLDYAHPVFELFRGPRSGDFSSARFFRYRPLDAKDGVLARFDDGTVALAEKKVGKGRVLVWTSTLDTLWSDLALQPVFLPFLHQLVRHAAGHVESRPWHTVGEALDLSAEPELRGRAAAVVAPMGEKQRLPAGQRALELTAPGFYEVRPRGGPWSRVAAVNFDASESDLASLDPEELAGAVTHEQGGDGARRGEPVLTTEEHESRQALWRWLLVAACLFLAAETVLASRVRDGRANE